MFKRSMFALALVMIGCSASDEGPTARVLVAQEGGAIVLGEGLFHGSTVTPGGDLLYVWADDDGYASLRLDLEAGSITAEEGHVMSNLLTTGDGRLLGCRGDGVRGFLHEYGAEGWGEGDELGAVRQCREEYEYPEDEPNACWSSLGSACQLVEAEGGRVSVTFRHRYGEDDAPNISILRAREGRQFSTAYTTDGYDETFYWLGWAGSDKLLVNGWGSIECDGGDGWCVLLAGDGDHEPQVLLDDAQVWAHAASPSLSVVAVRVYRLGDDASEDLREVRVYDSATGVEAPFRTFEGGLEDLAVTVVGDSAVLGYREEGAVKLEVDGNVIAVEDAAYVEELIPDGDSALHLVYQDSDEVMKLQSFELN